MAWYSCPKWGREGLAFQALATPAGYIVSGKIERRKIVTMHVTSIRVYIYIHKINIYVLVLTHWLTRGEKPHMIFLFSHLCCYPLSFLLFHRYAPLCNTCRLMSWNHKTQRCSWCKGLHRAFSSSNPQENSPYLSPYISSSACWENWILKISWEVYVADQFRHPVKLYCSQDIQFKIDD